MLSRETEHAFLQRLAEAGLYVENLVADGKLHRCGLVNKPNDKDGAYIAYDDELPTIWWQNWQTGDSDSWCSKFNDSFTPEQREAYALRTEEQRRVRVEEEAARHADGAARAKAIFDSNPPATPDHPYLVRKGVWLLGDVRVSSKNGSLIIPIYDGKNKIQTLQFIAPDGGKRFLTGGTSKGGWFPIQGKKGTVFVCEGYATGCSIHMATGATVVVAFSAGQIPNVAAFIRKNRPAAEIVICADADTGRELVIKGEGESANKTGLPVGMECALKAARECGGMITVPNLPEGSTGTDFNDLAEARGAEEVKKQLLEAVYPDELPVREWCLAQAGEFRVDDCDRDLSLHDADKKKARARAIQRLVAAGVLENVGSDSRKYRKRVTTLKIINIHEADPEKLNVWLPWGLHRHVFLHPKNVITVSGETNSGKTGLLLNVAWMNRKWWRVNYITSEMVGPEIRSRCEAFGHHLEEWDSVTFVERTSDFHDVIDPEGLNIIDFLEKNDRFYTIGEDIRKIFDALNTGIVFIATQKKKGEELGRGGDFALEKARLAVSMFAHGAADSGIYGSAKVTKAKNVIGSFNPQGREVFYHIEKGFRFDMGSKPEVGYSNGWQTRDKKDREGVIQLIQAYCKKAEDASSANMQTDFYDVPPLDE